MPLQQLLTPLTFLTLASSLALSCNATRRDAPDTSSSPNIPVESTDASTTADAGSSAVSDDGFIRLPELKDENPDPSIVEVSLSAELAPISIVRGRPHLHRTYNGSLPGPLIRAKKGDTLIVNLENNLDDPTTIHWHGMRVPNGMDGVPGVTQEVIKPGGSFRYEYELLDASAFWYHPHFRTLEQVGDGLYGAVLVSDPDEPDDLGEETVLAISDISLFEDGSVQSHAKTEELTVEGREGATLLVNGQPNQRMQVVSGQRLRWRVLNMARSRYLALRLDGHQLLRIGGDGGLNEFPVAEGTALLSPGERADFVLEPRGAPGTHLDLVTLPVDRGLHASTAVGPEILLRLEFTDAPAIKPQSWPELHREIKPFPTKDAVEIDIELTFGKRDGELVMGINGVHFDESTPLLAAVGAPQIWNIINATKYSHPFHLHGFHFQIIDEDGTPESPLRYKDTVDVPPLSTLRLVPNFENRPGKWMFHCHILDHAEAGMMGILELTEEDQGSGWPGLADRQGPPPPTGLNYTQEEFASLITSGIYHNAPWVTETREPRPRDSLASPHGDVRVYANDILLESIAKGNSLREGTDGLLEAFQGSPHDPGSMAVKEFYTDGEVVGHAVLLKLEGEAANTSYYCDGPQNRCGTQVAPPIYGVGLNVDCGFCHGGYVYTLNYPLADIE